MQAITPDFLQAKHISKLVYSGESLLTILKDINLTIRQGEAIAILGTSGSGKTTLLTLLAGLDLPTHGDIYFKSHHLNALDEEQRAKLRLHHIGFIFQSFQLLPTLTALENVMLPLEIRYVPHQLAKKKSLTWLEKVGLISRISHYPSQLSGGEQQRIAIARAFVSQPEIIFADEMTGNLDTETGEKICDILFALNKEEHTTLVVVTHDQSLAKRCDRQLFLQQGMITTCSSF